MRDTENKGGDKGGEKKRKWNKHYDFYFLVAVIFLYFLLFFFDPKGAYNALKVSGNIFIQIIPVLLLVILFYGVYKLFLTPKNCGEVRGKRVGNKRMALSYICRNN